MYRLSVFLIITNVVLNIIFASLDAFISIQLAFFANIFIPFISFIKLKKSLPKFQIACKPRFFLYNTTLLYTPKKGIKSNLSALKYSGIFFNIYKLFAYLIFIIITLFLIKNNLFNTIAFFTSCFIITLILIIERVNYAKNS